MRDFAINPALAEQIEVIAAGFFVSDGGIG
jgi:hypothetical protein